MRKKRHLTGILLDFLSEIGHAVPTSNCGLKLWRFHRHWEQEDREVSRKEIAMRELITLRVNGERHELAVLPHHTLLEVLRAAAGSGGAALCC